MLIRPVEEGIPSNPTGSLLRTHITHKQTGIHTADMGQLELIVQRNLSSYTCDVYCVFNYLTYS